jgi:cell division transport system permease protein
MFKNHVSLIFALIVMLLSIQSIKTLNKLANDYEQKITNSYSIVIVSYSAVTLDTLKNLYSHIKQIEKISPDKVIQNIKGGVSAANLALLKTSLPKFYRIKLDFYPSDKELENLKKILKKVKNITKIESFSKTQAIIYKMLVLNKLIIFIFAIMIFLIAALLVIRQMEIWKLRHNERMRIMAIFGAPLWLRSAVLFRLCIVDSILASVLVVGFFYYLSSSKTITAYLNELGIGHVGFDVISGFFVLFAMALAISILSVSYVVVRSDQEK